MLEVYTARYSTKDRDRLDVTRKGRSRAFAPSWDLLAPIIKIRQSGRDETAEEWASYRESYTGEMRRSYRKHPGEWRALLARERVVLVCFCNNPERCHRRVLAEILEKLGARDRGELPEGA